MAYSKLFYLVDQEKNRQKEGINLIASENYTPKIIRDLVGSVLMNKYIEGKPGHRYYSGCAFIDQIELEAIELFKKLFNADHANVQPHSGSQANFAVYFALLQPGDIILSMNLASGGHLTHGAKVSMSGSLYKIISYGVDPKTELIDYNEIQRLAYEHKPKLIIAGASSYARTIDFKKFSEIAYEVQAYFMADIAHTAGLIAAGIYQSPVAYADIVTLTTQKTFRGPRGGVILCKAELAAKIDRAVMPGIQGGAFGHEIAAKALSCHLAMNIDFVDYQKKVVACAKAMAAEFYLLGYKVVSGGTDTHLLLLDIRALGITGKDVEKILEKINIFVNRNAIPFDTLPPLQAGGIRIGTAAIVSRGATLADCIQIVQIIHGVLSNMGNNELHEELKAQVKKITSTWNEV
ncbi:serine hydroxymethyltransferase [Candidatus Dependentiae bacterium]|nr:serine hydroxymethyltransferase [Candidatus Dependentiae bacterium]